LPTAVLLERYIDHEHVPPASSLTSVTVSLQLERSTGRISMRLDPDVALLDPLDQDLRIKLVEAGRDLQEFRGLWLLGDGLDRERGPVAELERRLNALADLLEFGQAIKTRRVAIRRGLYAVLAKQPTMSPR
jgi:hypothetical protein